MKMKKGGLGKGLGSLFEETAIFAQEDENALRMIALSEITPDPNQPRKYFDATALSELSASIAEHGVLQPIVVRQVSFGNYVIIAGERRWRAARLAGLQEMPALVRDFSASRAMEIALIENLQREDLDPVEEAMGYRQLMDRCDYTQETVAVRLGKSRSSIANSLRLLHLTQACLIFLRKGEISVGHAKVLLSLDEEKQEEVAKLIIEKNLSVRQTEEICKKLNQDKKEQPLLFRESLPCEVELSLQSVWVHK